MMRHNGLKTKEVLAQKHITNPYCKNYGSIEETMIHALRDCASARHTWLTLVDNKHWDIFFDINSQKRIQLNLQ